MAQASATRRGRTIAPMFYSLAALVLVFGIIALIGGNASGFLLAIAFTIVFGAVGYYFQQVQPSTVYGTPEYEEYREEKGHPPSEEPTGSTFQSPPSEPPTPEERPGDEGRR